MKKVSLLFLIALVVTSTGASASGLAIPEQGAAAMGMAAAMTARSENLSAIYYNPAGIDYVEKTELFLGFTPIMPVHQYEGTTESEDANKMAFYPPNIYAAHRLNNRIVFGFGMYTPFGLGTDWNSKWYGRYTSTFGEIQSLYITPSVAIKLHDMVSFGASYSWIWSGAVIKKKIDSGLAIYSATAAANPAAANPKMISNPSYDSEFALDGDGGGVSYTLGLMLRPMSTVQIGISYTGTSEITYKGTAKFTHPKGYESMLSAMMPAFQDGDATLNLPSSINVGLKYDLTTAWDAEVDVNIVDWTTYDKLVIDLKDNLPYDTITSPKNWDKSTIVRLGTSYDLNAISTARFGFLYDKSPVPDETFDAQLPDNNRIGFSVGYGRKFGNITFDVSYMFLKFSDRDKDNLVGYVDAGSIDPTTGAVGPKDGVVDAADKAILDGMMAKMGRSEYPVGNGTYKSHVNLLSFSASYHF
ncbi:outer membrane protein transport protein [bacterium]|nr:outer membrane protein transport protein [bacterium]